MDSLNIAELPNDLAASFEKHVLTYRKPAGTSRGVLTEKKLWLIQLSSPASPVIGIGECSIIPGLSPDYTSDEAYEKKLAEICAAPSRFLHTPSLLEAFPSLLFGLETAYIDWKNGGRQVLFDNAFTRCEQPIPINGLIWMGTEQEMQDQLEEKLAAGFTCLKMKIGAIDFQTELRLLASVRKRFSAEQITLRVDANGAFSPREALEKLTLLSRLELHSIEQPIQAGQRRLMENLCRQTPLPIALDEELIGITGYDHKRKLLETIKPQYIILKPSLHGGFSGCIEWIQIADELHIPFWLTSALESNIGLNAIAQFAGNFDTDLPQGLGTGGLYTTNFEARSRITNGHLFYQPTHP